MKPSKPTPHVVVPAPSTDDETTPQIAESPSPEHEITELTPTPVKPSPASIPEPTSPPVPALEPESPLRDHLAMAVNASEGFVPPLPAMPDEGLPDPAEETPVPDEATAIGTAPPTMPLLPNNQEEFPTSEPAPEPVAPAEPGALEPPTEMPTESGEPPVNPSAFTPPVTATEPEGDGAVPPTLAESVAEMPAPSLSLLPERVPPAPVEEAPTIPEPTITAPERPEAAPDPTIAAPEPPVTATEPPVAEPAPEASITTPAPAIPHEPPPTELPAPQALPPTTANEPAPATPTEDAAAPRPAIPAFAPPPSPRSTATANPGGESTDSLIPLPNAGKSVPLDVSAASPPRPAVTVASDGNSAKDETTTAEPYQIEPLLHKVQKGENFWTISRLYYRSGRFWQALWKANEDLVPDPKILYVGTTIRVPPLEALDRSTVEEPLSEVRGDQRPSPTSVNQASPTARRDSQMSRARNQSDMLVMLPSGSPSFNPPAEEQPAPEPEPENEPAYHIVRPHETLRSIARDTLGDAHRDEEIRNLNLKVLDGRISLIAGQRLRLPDDARPDKLRR